MDANNDSDTNQDKSICTSTSVDEPTTVVMSQDYNILSRTVLELAGIRSGWRYAFLLVLDLVGSDGA